jgi:hypothetical protein
MLLEVLEGSATLSLLGNPWLMLATPQVGLTYGSREQSALIANHSAELQAVRSTYSNKIGDVPLWNLCQSAAHQVITLARADVLHEC